MLPSLRKARATRQKYCGCQDEIVGRSLCIVVYAECSVACQTTRQTRAGGGSRGGEGQEQKQDVEALRSRRNNNPLSRMLHNNT